MVYAACKAAVVHLSKVTAMSVADDSIRVNAICPGYIATPLSTNTVGRPDSLIEGRIEGMEHQQPIPRVGRPGEVAEVILFLATDEGSYCTGSEFVADGGWFAGMRNPSMPCS